MFGAPRLGAERSPDSSSGSPEAPVEPPGARTFASGGDRGPVRDVLTITLWVLRAGPALMLVGVVLAAALSTPLFLTTKNIGNVLDASAVIAVLAIGQLLVIITRGIDLSVGSTVAL